MTQSLFNWVQTFDLELYNAGLKEPGFREARVRFCQEVLERSPEGYLQHQFKSALAESYLILGLAKGDELFEGWLAEEPTWGQGWIAWADCYWFGTGRDAARAEQILQRGLQVPGVADREQLLKRLHHLYQETGRKQQAQAVQRQIDVWKTPKVTTRVTKADQTLQVQHRFDFGEEGLPVAEFGRFAEALREGVPPFVRAERVGRNDPCPCGRGKKFKRCCGH